MNRIKDLVDGILGKNELSPPFPMPSAPYYEVTIQIWDDEEEKTYYSIVQEFSEVVDDHEVLAYGEANNREHAVRLVGAELRQMFP